jgi:hypothetical protein
VKVATVLYSCAATAAAVWLLMFASGTKAAPTHLPVPGAARML